MSSVLRFVCLFLALLNVNAFSVGITVCVTELEVFRYVLTCLLRDTVLHGSLLIRDHDGTQRC